MPSRWATCGAASGIWRARAGGDDDQVDVGGAQPAGRQRLAAGGDRHLDERLVRAGDPPRSAMPTRLDPLVVGVHPGGQVVVGHPAARPVVAERQDARPGGARPRSWIRSSRSLRVETGDRVAGVDEVALVDQPLGQYPVVAGGDMVLLAAAADGAERGAGGQRVPSATPPG